MYRASIQVPTLQYLQVLVPPRVQAHPEVAILYTACPRKLDAAEPPQNQVEGIATVCVHAIVQTTRCCMKNRHVVLDLNDQVKG